MKNNLISKIIFLLLGVVSLTPLVFSPLALALGFFVAMIVGNPYQEASRKYIHLLLQISIVGLGFGLHADEAFHAGKTGFLLTITSIATVLVLGYLIGRLIKVEKPITYLVSVGTAICGGSAIAAVSPIIKADSKQISLALAIIFTLNSLALFLYPSIGHWLHLSQEQFGLWCAVGIHDTSSVVSAANQYGNEALKVATTVKLARALWIIPVSLLTMSFFRSKDSKIKIPWFIGLFVLAILANTFIPAITIVGEKITLASKAGLNLTLYLIGSTLSLSTLKSIGFKPLLLSVILWIIVSLESLFFILHQ